jgi:hypothetical protein
MPIMTEIFVQLWTRRVGRKDKSAALPSGERFVQG